MKLYTLLLLALGFSFASCSMMDTDPSRVIGIISWDRGAGLEAHPSASAVSANTSDRELLNEQDFEPIEIPEEVEAGVPFTVTVRTIGADGCWSPDGLEVEVSPASVRLTPYDAVLRDPNVGCFDAYMALSREVELTFAERGAHEVVLVGRRVVGANDPFGGETITTRRTVTAR